MCQFTYLLITLGLIMAYLCAEVPNLEILFVCLLFS
jgi:hypothetical protein